MASEFRSVQWGDFAEFRYGRMPNKNRVKDTTGMYPVYSGYRMTGWYDEWNTYEDELIVVARGVGGTGDVKMTPRKCFLTNLSIAVLMDESVAIKKYLYYYFSLRNLRYLDSGSAQSQITISDLQKVILPLPPLDTQRAIVNILSVLDARIEVNKKINDNLAA